jgi:hypothetical protein
MPPRWQYLCTTNAHDADSLTRHKNAVASDGWELMTVTFAIKGESGVHDFFWRRAVSAQQTSGGT